MPTASPDPSRPAHWAMALPWALVLLMLLPSAVMHAQGSEGPNAWQFLLERSDSAKNSGRYEEALTLLDSAMVRSHVAHDQHAVGEVLVRQAFLRQMLGQYDQALMLLYRALTIREATDDQRGLAEVENNIGSIHQNQKNYDKAREYYQRSLAIYDRLGMRREVGKCYNNFGALYEDMGRPAEAQTYHRHSLAIWEALRDTGWIGVSDMHLGTCQQLLGHLDSARYYLMASKEALGTRNGSYHLGLVNVLLGNNERMAGRPRSALRYCGEALRIAEGMNILPFEQRACECLYQAYDDLGEKGSALEMYKRDIQLRDSLFGQANVKEMTRIELAHAYAQKQLTDSLDRARTRLEEELRHQAALSREREGRNIAVFSGIGILALAFGLWRRLVYVRRSRARIQYERERSDQLLLNILPAAVAQELKDHGRAEARDFPRVTILFTDLKDFTAISERMTAQDLVAEIHACFQAFDTVMERYGIEKIKTIGDAYMAAGGLPDPERGTPLDVVHAALDMQALMRARKAGRDAQGLPAFEMRVGIHTGPVVAGIVGSKKFQYDVWGDTVNTASRMESAGDTGLVNISAATHALVKDAPDLVFTERGMVKVKGKGALGMYFVGRVTDGVRTA
ncbi:MAG: tetratricopeptide repeat protein [Flavobacteriales bacterium]|nr:tetratricopeptide repeat protein [Flavobacteriales bacterium]